MTSTKIKSIVEFISYIKTDYAGWNTRNFPWFRGEPTSETPLLPRLFREKKSDGSPFDENQLLQFFRMKAPSLGVEHVPPRERHIDQWLFLAQHVGLPTRLIDWSEGALVALYFALKEREPIVWMLNPMELNRMSLNHGDELKDNQFPLTWIFPEDNVNLGSENIRCAWEQKRRGLNLPVAVHPTNIHPRMSAQKSCFTIHGKIEKPLTELISGNHLKKYEIDPNASIEMQKELRMLGISYSSLFPDLDGLSKELSETF